MCVYYKHTIYMHTLYINSSLKGYHILAILILIYFYNLIPYSHIIYKYFYIYNRQYIYIYIPIHIFIIIVILYFRNDTIKVYNQVILAYNISFLISKYFILNNLYES